MRVRFTEEAEARLSAIKSYVSHDSPARARDLIARIIKRAESLHVAPRRGCKVPEFARDEIREVSESPYRIIYRLRGDSIDIITVMHVRQLIPADLIDRRAERPK